MRTGLRLRWPTINPPSGTEAARYVRGETRIALADRECVDVDDIVLATLELVTAATAQTAAPVAVSLMFGNGRARVEVYDESGALAHDHSAVLVMRLVELVSLDWGWSLTDRGKVVWCELAC